MKNYQLALQAINEMLLQIGGTELENVPMMQAVRVDVTERAVALLEQLNNSDEMEQDIEFEIGRAYQQLGHLQWNVGQQEAAEASLKKAIAIFRKLWPTTDSPVEIQRQLIESYKSLANSMRDLGRFEEAIDHYQQVESAAEQLRQHTADDEAADREIALNRASQALALVEMGSPDAAESCYVQALEIARELIDADGSVRNLYCLAAIQYNLGGLYLNQNRWQEAEVQITASIEAFTAVLKESRVDPQVREWLAIAYGHLGVLCFRTSRLDDAERAYREQIQTLTKLSGDFPAVPSYRHEAAVGRGNLASVLRAQGHPDEAGDELEAAINSLRALVADFPDVHMYRKHLADSQFNAGNRSLALNQPEAAVDYYSRSQQAYQTLSSALPEREDLREAIAATMAQLGGRISQGPRR